MSSRERVPRLEPFFKTRFLSLDAFFADAERGNLPTYSFIEPRLLYAHNDMHPPINGVAPGLNLDLPSSLLGGEALLKQVYDAVRTATTASGSNFANTLLLVAFDEHGGTYDQVPPPPATPPAPAAPPGQMGFAFDRSGVRLPAVAISAYLEPGTVVSEEYRNTSLIRTLRERWPLGGPLTARDATAADIAPRLTRDAPRRQEDWPDVVAPPVPGLSGPVVPLDEPLDPEARAILEAALAHEKKTTGYAPAVNLDTVTGKEAVAILDEFATGIFPSLAGKSGG